MMEQQLPHRLPKSQCCIVVASCDNYEDTWEPFYRMFSRFWPDCPFPVYHVANRKQCSWTSNTIAVGDDLSWSENLSFALRQLGEKYVLLFIDDLFLLQTVKTAEVLDALAWLERMKGQHLRLAGFPPPEVPIDSMYGTIARGAAYRVSTVSTLWDRAALLSLLKNGESPWEFEVNGSVRAESRDGFFATRKPLFVVCNAIIKGRWWGRALRSLRKIGEAVEQGGRPRMPWRQEAAFAFRVFVNRSLYRLPISVQRYIQAVPRRHSRPVKTYAS